jgi:hypothetical protein
VHQYETERVKVMVAIQGKITINTLNLEQVKETVDILKLIFEDERIPLEVRDEYVSRLHAIEWKRRIPIHHFNFFN